MAARSTGGWDLILPFLRPLEPLILDDAVSEVMVNAGARVFVERLGALEPVPGVSLSRESLLAAARNIARRLGDDISEAKPILDSRLADGSRVAAVLEPASVGGITLTIRKFTARHFTAEDLVSRGTLTAGLAELLAERVASRASIVISGGTGTGKTTLLGILADAIPDDERVVLIEDTAEIHLKKSNLVRFEARREQPGLPAITIRDLVRASLRHRPDRIVVGEIRGGEAYDWLQALNTGHSGSLTTIHANSARDALSRAVSCVLQGGIELPYRAIKSSIADSVDLLVHVERLRGQRRVSEVLELKAYDPDADRFDLRPVAPSSPAAREAAQEEGSPA